MLLVQSFGPQKFSDVVTMHLGFCRVPQHEEEHHGASMLLRQAFSATFKHVAKHGQSFQWKS